MTTTRISPLLLSLLIGGLTALAVVIVIFMDDSGAPVDPTPAVVEAPAKAEVPANTIAAAWQWADEPATEAPAIEGKAVSSDNHKAAEPLPFTAESVYDALQAVKLDDDGDVITDNEALLALEAALGAGGVTLTADQIAALQAVIRQGLPGKAGEQTAQIVGNYAELLKAEADFNELYGSENGAYVVDGEDMSVDDYEAQYQELQALREVYMGSEVASSLFATANASAQYMFESQRLENDPSLSAEEKLQRAAELEHRLVEQTTGIRDWHQRYQSFLAEKQQVMGAGLSESQKREQVAVLMQQHFDREELQKVSHLPLDDVSDIN